MPTKDSNHEIKDPEINEVAKETFGTPLFKCTRKSTGETIYSDKVMVGGKEIVDRFLFNDNLSISLDDAKKNKEEYLITKEQ